MLIERGLSLREATIKVSISDLKYAGLTLKFYLEVRTKNAYYPMP